MITGLGPLIIRSAGVFSKVLIRCKNTPTGNFCIHEKRMKLSGRTIGSLYACNLILFASEVISGLVIRVLTKPVNRCIASFSFLLRFVQSAIHGFGLVYRILVLQHRKKTGYFNITKPGLLLFGALQSFPATQ